MTTTMISTIFTALDLLLFTTYTVVTTTIKDIVLFNTDNSDTNDSTTSTDTSTNTNDSDTSDKDGNTEAESEDKGTGKGKGKGRGRPAKNKAGDKPKAPRKPRTPKVPKVTTPESDSTSGESKSRAHTGNYKSGIRANGLIGASMCSIPARPSINTARAMSTTAGLNNSITMDINGTATSTGVEAKAYNPSFQAHPFHMVDNSPWPLMISLSLIALTINAVMYFWTYKNPFGDSGVFMLVTSLVCTVIIISLWFRDIIVEGTMLGDHTAKVKESLSLGFARFVISEVFFFISIFWAYLHSSLSPTVELGAYWPPQGISAINPFELPLLNTILLLSSGAALTFSHHGLMNISRKPSTYGLIVTLALAVLFTACQGIEYYNAEFTFSDGVYGSTFYMATGFHGLHVIVGTIFLTVTTVRLINYHLTTHHHVGYESAAIYWHFVDVVWLGLYILVYWWGS